MPDWLTQFINSAVVVGLVAFIARSVFQALDKLSARLEAHEKECAEIPKSTIEAKLEALAQQQHEHHEENKDRLREVKNALQRYHERTGKVEDAVIGLERDLRWILKQGKSEA